MSSKLAISNPNQRGSALLVVLVMMGVIAVLAAAVARSISGAALELSAARINAETEADLRAGIELGVAAILKLGDEMRSADATVNLAGRQISVHVSNERARIDLNKAKSDVLTGLLKAEGLEDNEAASLATNIAQWRGGTASSEKPAAPGQDDSHLGGLPRSFSSDVPGGFESKPAPKQMPTLHFFFHPIQLMSVPGFSKTLVKRLFPSLTVANGANQINPFIAGPDVLSALPGASSSKVEAFLDARVGNVSRDTAIQLFGVDKELLSEDRASGWRLQITIKQRSGRLRHSEAVVAGVNNDDGDPYRVLYVLDDADQYARQAKF